MLAYVLFLTALLGMASAAVLEGGVAFARASARHAAERYAEVGLLQARAQLVAGIAAQIQTGTAQLAAPQPLEAGAPCTSAPCPMALSAEFALEGATAVSGNANAVANGIQSHPSIVEQRVAARIVATVRAADATPLAVRTEYLTLRTLAVPPYAMIEGASDGAAARDAADEADAAGCDPSQPNRCDGNNASAATAAPWTPGTMSPADTRVHAISRCVDDGSGGCAGRAYLSADPDAPEGTPWYNANAAGSGWTR